MVDRDANEEQGMLAKKVPKSNREVSCREENKVDTRVVRMPSVDQVQDLWSPFQPQNSNLPGEKAWRKDCMLPRATAN